MPPYTFTTRLSEATAQFKFRACGMYLPMPVQFMGDSATLELLRELESVVDTACAYLDDEQIPSGQTHIRALYSPTTNVITLVNEYGKLANLNKMFMPASVGELKGIRAGIRRAIKRIESLVVANAQSYGEGNPR